MVTPAGTTALMLVLELTVNDVALTELNVTEETPVKFTPVIVTVVPWEAEAGAKL